MSIPAPDAHWANDSGVEAAIASHASQAPYTPLGRADLDSAACLSQMRVDLQQRLGTLLGGQRGWAGLPRDFADAADDHQQRHSDAHLARILISELQQVERALERLMSGQYGICEDCAEPIPPRRMERLPATTRCVACQARSEVRAVG